MKTVHETTLILIVTLAFFSCIKDSSNSIAKERVSIEMVTDYGTVILELYNETPLHRDNVIKLINQGAFDSLLFHC